MSSSVCKKCKRHVPINYIDMGSMLCWDCASGRVDQLKHDPRFATPAQQRKTSKRGKPCST